MKKKPPTDNVTHILWVFFYRFFALVVFNIKSCCPFHDWLFLACWATGRLLFCSSHRSTWYDNVVLSIFIGMCTPLYMLMHEIHKHIFHKYDGLILKYIYNWNKYVLFTIQTCRNDLLSIIIVKNLTFWYFLFCVFVFIFHSFFIKMPFLFTYLWTGSHFSLLNRFFKSTFKNNSTNFVFSVLALLFVFDLITYQFKFTTISISQSIVAYVTKF